MFLHNFWEIIRCIHTFSGAVTGSANGQNNGIKHSIKWKGWTPSASPMGYFFYPLEIATNTANANDNTKNAVLNMTQPLRWSSISVGTSDTEVSLNDYQLGTDVTSSFSNAGFTGRLTGTDNGIKQVLVWSGVNNTNSDITIKEIGIYHYVWLGNTSPMSYSNTPVNSPKQALCIRHILDNPVTIPAGTLGTVILEIDLF